MKSKRPLIRLTGYRSAEEIDALFSSQMVDVASVYDITPDEILISCDDPDWPKDSHDYDWLRTIISSVLTENGITGFELTFVPPQKS